MPIPADVTRCTIHGTAAGVETFEFGFWLKTNAPINDDAANLVASSVADAFTTDLLPAVRAHNTTDTFFTGVRVYGYPTGGPTASSVGSASIVGGAGTDTGGSVPLQCSMCCTLLTGNAGRRNRGRLYLPMNGFPYTNHMFTSSIVDTIGTALGAFFTNWRANHGAAMGNPAVVSVAGGVAKEISSIAIDNKPDVQRRRANKLLPTHTQTVAVV